MSILDHELFKSGLREFGIELSKYQLEQFDKYYFSLIKWNEITNLTSITDPKEVIIKHFIDSVTSCRFFKYYEQRIIDIGSGAGFPGLPIKIVFPEISISFVDSSNKKSEILKKICFDIGINSFEIINDNIENIGRKVGFRESFDICLSRAVSSLGVLIEYSMPLLKVKGSLIAYKGPNCSEEVENSYRALDELGGKITENSQFNLPFSDYKRSIIIVEKLWKTDDKYPRKAGVPKKKPI
jgi:16S rRNA (guanine527-N7)-methyltransferase